MIDLISESGITEFINTYSPIPFSDLEVLLLFAMVALTLLLVWVLYMHFKTQAEAKISNTKIWNYGERVRDVPI